LSKQPSIPKISPKKSIPKPFVIQPITKDPLKVPAGYFSNWQGQNLGEQRNKNQLQVVNIEELTFANENSYAAATATLSFDGDDGKAD
jgi:hypothetical protein